MDRKYKMDDFFAYKAWLNPKRMIPICGKRYIDRVEDVTNVTVDSNKPAVNLFANGKSLATIVFLSFLDVPNAGTTRLVAVAGMMGTMNINFTKEEFLNANAKLNKI